MRRSTRWILAATAWVVVVAGCTADDRTGTATRPSPPGEPARPVPPVGGPGEGAAPAPTLPPVTSPPVTAPRVIELPGATPVPLRRPLALGARGEDVRWLQLRLRDLRFDPGEPDGVFGPETQQAVWAFQKFALGWRGEAVDGVVTAEVWDRMQQPLRVEPRRPDGTNTRLEVDLPSQTAVLYKGGDVRLITHVSTGSGREWCAKGWCGKAVTPSGVYQVTRIYPDGWRDSKLGRLYNPVFFNGGIAVHGFESVPNRPASKGCVRIPMHVAEYFHRLIRWGDQVFVFDGVAEPETYGSPRQPPDTPDPNVPDDQRAPVPDP